MGFNFLKKPQIYLILSWVVVLISYISSLIIPPILGMDVWDGLDTIVAYKYFNAPLNHKIWFNPENIAEIDYEYMGWFAPAQYMIPWAIHNLTNFSLGVSASTSYFIAWVIGFFGFRKLYTLFSIPDIISSIAVFVISTQYFTLMPYFELDSADPYLLAFMPWAAIYFLKERNHLELVISVPVLVLLASFLKFNALILIIPLPVIFYFHEYIITRKISLQHLILKLSIIAFSYMFTYYIIKINFLDKGVNVSQLNEFSLYWSDIIFPFAANITGMLSLDNTIDFIFKAPLHTMHLGWKLAPQLFFAYLLFLIVFLLIQYFNLQSFKRHSLYSFYLIVYPFLVAPFYMVLYFFNTSADNTTRLYFFGAFILLPFFIQLVNRFNLSRAIFVLFFLSNLFIQANHLFDVKKRVAQENYYVTGSQGFSYNYLDGDKEVLNLLLEINENSSEGDLIVLPVMGLSLELTNMRYIVFHEQWNLNMQLGWHDDFYGKVENLYVLSNKKYADKSIEEYIYKFIDYETAIKIDSTESFYMYKLI